MVAAAHEPSLDDVEIGELLQLGLPVVVIETIDEEEPTYEPVDSQEGQLGGSIRNATKVPGRVVVQDLGGIIYDSGNYEKKTSGMTVKVRGNWSARRPKKPYKIKLQVRADMLGRGDHCYDDQNWLLLPFFDMTSFVGLKVNELMGLQWTPQYRFVNVVFNGEFRGLYLLTEAVERNPSCRLNVARTGFIVELDAYWWNESQYLEASFEEPLKYTFKYPDEDDLTPARKNRIQEILSAAEDSTLDSTYQKHIDVESFARWMLAHDILGNRDGAGSNMFITKYNDQDTSLLKMGCMWDFEVVMESSGWDELHGRYYFGRLFANSDRTFVNRYTALWEEMKDSVFGEMQRYISTYLASDLCKAMDNSIILNNERWASEMSAVPLSEELLAKALVWFGGERMAWLDEVIPSLSLPITAIQGIKHKLPEQHVYDLYGRRQNQQLRHGVYIVNGRKVVR